MINILADRYLYKINEFLPDSANLTLFDSDKPLTEVPGGTDALLIRTVTSVNQDTFPRFPESLKFIGTGSAGADHVDREYLQTCGIGFSNAAGCNARSVGEYVAVTLLLWAEAMDYDLTEYTVGIVGVGHTGGQVLQLLNGLDVHTVCYDPPREQRDNTFTSASLDEVLNADILTFHTPLNRSGNHPTFHWLNEEKLEDASFKLILNASRGSVVDESALLKAFDNSHIEDFVLDVWENEPVFSDAAARRAFAKTPHIAGYSVQAKERATTMIIDAMTQHLSASLQQPPRTTAAGTGQTPPDTFWSLTDALTYYHPIRDYETRLKMLVGRSDQARAEGFNRIRTRHPFRNELHTFDIPDGILQKFPALRILSTKKD